MLSPYLQDFPSVDIILKLRRYLQTPHYQSLARIHAHSICFVYAWIIVILTCHRLCSRLLTSCYERHVTTCVPLYQAKNGKFWRTLCTYSGGVTNYRKMSFPEFQPSTGRKAFVRIALKLQKGYFCHF